jgi:hypothetical protein
LEERQALTLGLLSAKPGIFDLWLKQNKESIRNLHEAAINPPIFS